MTAWWLAYLSCNILGECSSAYNQNSQPLQSLTIECYSGADIKRGTAQRLSSIGPLKVNNGQDSRGPISKLTVGAPQILKPQCYNPPLQYHMTLPQSQLRHRGQQESYWRLLALRMAYLAGLISRSSWLRSRSFRITRFALRWDRLVFCSQH